MHVLFYMFAQDICVGDFWETQERRAIADFTTGIAVDKFMLVTMLESLESSSFAAPTEFDTSRHAKHSVIDAVKG